MFWFINGVVVGLAAGVFLVGIVAPWLVADTALSMEDQLREWEYDEEAKRKPGE